MTDSQRHLLTLLDRVCDEHTFLEFATALAQDRADEVDKERLKPSSPWGPGANGWQNTTIETFLSAAIAWARAMRFGRNSPDGRFNPNPWNQFANFLWCGKIYE